MELLIIEDEPTVAAQLKNTLNKEQFKVQIASSVDEAKKLMDKQDFDLILLDWNLPDGDGIELMQLWRKFKITTPILVLSAKNEINDRVHALDSGADDYLCKPYSGIELLARIRALLRRESAVKSSILHVGNVSINLAKREVISSDKEVHFSSAEFDLLSLLFQHQNTVLTRYQLSEHICKDFERLTQSNLIDVHIRNIRKKLQAPDLISTIRGVGYSVKT